MTAKIWAQLESVLEKDSILQDPDACRSYALDWTRFREPAPLGVVLPRTPQEVAAVLKICQESSVAVVPSGGRTGLAGGAVASAGELVLSLQRLTRIGSLNPLTRTVRVQAGVINEVLQEICAQERLFWPIELGSKGSCTVGGNIATNAGGVRVIRYGHTRQWVLSLQVALMSGDLIELNGDLEKNNTGYDLRQLLIGSEGTLGVVTEATLKLAPIVSRRHTFFLGMGSLVEVMEMLKEMRQQAFPIMAFECMTENCLQSVLRHRSQASPLEQQAPFYALVEVEAQDESLEQRLSDWMEKILASGHVRDGTWVENAAQARRLWELREGITESLAARGLVYKNDISLPVMKLEAFVTRLRSEAPRLYPDSELFVFGHVGDGNVHLNVLNSSGRSVEDFRSLCEKANREIFAWIQEARGSIAAEHGVGLLKKDFLLFTRSPVELEIFRGIKRVWDPAGLLNPGKIFDLESRPTLR